MGGALAAFVAERRDVAGVVFINPLVKVPSDELLDGLQALLDSGVETIESIGSDIKKEGTVEASYSATPLACAASLFEGVTRQIQDNLVKITAPSLLLSSREDHVVTSDNGDEIVASTSGPVERLWLENSYHVATLDNDQEFVESSALHFLETIFSS